MLTAWTVAALAADIPLRDLFGLNVVVHRVAAVACWTGRAFHVIRRIKRIPPVRPLRYEVRFPYVVGHVPLCRLWKIIIADFCKVALLPDASIDECHVCLRELLAHVVRGEVGDYGFG